MNKNPDTLRQSHEPFHRRYRTFFVGLFIAVPLVLLPGFLVFTFLKADVLEKTAYLYVKYPSAAGVTKGTVVTILGMNVGYIKNVALNQAGHIDVCMKIRQTYMILIKKDSKARLQQKNVAFGDWEIELTGAAPQSPGAAAGDTLTGEVQAPIARTLEQVNKTIDTFQKILQTVLDGKGTLGRLIKEDTLLSVAQTIGRRAAILVGHANSTLTAVDTVMRAVEDIGSKGKQLTDSVARISGTVHTLVADVDSLVGGIRSASKGLPDLMNKVQSDISEVELVLKALQNNWLLKGSINSQKDPMLDEKQ